MAEDFIRAFDADRSGQPDKEHTMVRMTCSWATKPEDIDEVERMLSPEESEAF